MSGRILGKKADALRLAISYSVKYEVSLSYFFEKLRSDNLSAYYVNTFFIFNQDMSCSLTLRNS